MGLRYPGGAFFFGGMMKDLMLFEAPEFGNVRAVEIDGEAWVVAADVARALGYSNPSKAILDHCKFAKSLNYNESGALGCGSPRGLVVIPERDVYRLVMRSKLPGAERFEEWVVGEVLPSIRKHGGYVVGRPEDTPEEIMARALLVAQETMKRRGERIAALEVERAEMLPKAEFVDKFVDSSGLQTLTSVSKTLGFKRKDLIEKLIADGMVFRRGDRLEPYADKVARGLFVMKAGEKGGYSFAQMYVTPKGISWIASRYMSELAES